MISRSQSSASRSWYHFLYHQGFLDASSTALHRSKTLSTMLRQIQIIFTLLEVSEVDMRVEKYMRITYRSIAGFSALRLSSPSRWHCYEIKGVLTKKDTIHKSWIYYKHTWAISVFSVLATTENVRGRCKTKSTNPSSESNSIFIVRS